MNILFQNAPLAGLAGLIAIPLALHLFARTKPPRFLFSATEFLARAVRHTLRVKRPKDWLLLLCRTLLFTALALAFLRPVFYRGRLADSGSARHRVVIVDRTASMAWTEGGRSRFAAACAEASQMLEGLGAKDTANVVWLDSEPDAVFPEMGFNTGYLKTQLSEARVTNETGDPDAAVSLALSLLKASAGLREVCLISDFQTTQWKRAVLDVPPEVQVTTLSVAGDESPNGALTALRTEPLLPIPGEVVQVVAEVANYSGQPRARTVVFEVEEARLSRSILVPAWGKASAAVDHVFRKPGECPIQARLDEDAFGADDWRGGLVPVRPALRVGLAAYDSGLATIWGRALRAMPWMEPAAVASDKLKDAGGLDLLLLAGWEGEDSETLNRLREAGLPLVCAPAAGLDMRSLASAAGIRPAAGKVEWEILKEPSPLAIDNPRAPLFALFKDGDYGNPAAAVASRRWKIAAGSLDGESWLSYADGSPAVFRCAGETPLVIWTVPLDPEACTWAAQLSFLPFFGELIGHIRSTKNVPIPIPALPGERLNWMASLRNEAVRLMDSQGGELRLTSGQAGLEGRLLVSDPIRQPGLYQWMADSVAVKAAVVNFPEGESDLRFEPAPVGTGQAVRNAAEMRTLQEGLPLWPFLVWIAAALIVLESLLVLWVHLDGRRLMERANG